MTERPVSVIASLRFTGELPPLVVVLIASIAAIGVVWLYSRETRTIDNVYSYLLPALRATAVVLTIFVLAGPVWHSRKVHGTLGHVVFAIDQSASMSITDSSQEGSTPSRIARAANVLLGSENRDGWLQTLKESHDVDVIAFADGEPSMLWSSRSESPIPTTFELSPDGANTDLSSGLRTTLDSIDPNQTDVPDALLADTDLQRAAFVMMTDGRDNAGESAVDVAKQLKSQSIVVHAVGIGSEGEPPDAGIVNIVRPESVASDGVLAGSLVLKQFGMAGQPLQVRIESAGKTVWQQTINTSGDGLQRVPFRFDVEPIVKSIAEDSQRGVLRSTVVMDLRASIDALNADSTDDNNAKSFRVAANTRDRRLLIVDGSSRWETRYLRNVFERDRAWTVNTVLVGDGTGHPKLIRGDDTGQFPATREEMSRYDAMIFGEVEEGHLNASDLLRIREFVTRGGGLIAIDGRYGHLRRLIRSDLADLLPVRYDKSPSRIRGELIRPTALGLEHPVMNLTGDTEGLAEFWEQMPAGSAANNVTAQEGAEVWADAVASNGVSSPWLVTRLFGAGRVFYFSSDQTWRWRYKVADRFHARFWNQLMTAVMQPPYSASDEYVALGTNKIDYRTGESSTIRVRLHDTSGKPVGDATVDALLIKNDRVVATVPLAFDDPSRGTYRGETPALAAGAYQVRIRASGFDESALQASTPIWVADAETAEMRRVGLDVSTLTQVTAAAGGTYAHESDADTLLDHIRPLSSGTIVESDILIWQSFYWFWVVIALLAIEWWLRKRAGLV